MISEPRMIDGRKPNISQHLYGRRRGKKLRNGRQRMLDHHLSELLIPLRASSLILDPRCHLFAKPLTLDQPVWLEIGFGHGEHLATQMQAYPDVHFIGVEYYINGIAALLAKLTEESFSSSEQKPHYWPLRLIQDDARLMLAQLEPASIDRVFILHPDPWPKKRHHKRRLIVAKTLDMLSNCMRCGALLRLASDDADYIAWMLEHLLRHADFEWLACSAQDWQHNNPKRPSDWPVTKYERKAIDAGRSCYLLQFRRRDRGNLI